MMEAESALLVAENEHPDLGFAIRESSDLAKAMVLVWLKERKECFDSEYRVVAIEPELRTTLWSNQDYEVVLMMRPDAVLERRQDGALLQWELKTKQSITSNWINGWEHNLQLVAQQLGIQEYARQSGLSDRSLAGAFIEALIKGRRERDESDGLIKQQSPLIYAYSKPGDGLLVQDQLSPSWKKGWRKSLTSDFLPLEEWIFNRLPSEVTAIKAVIVPPIQPSADEIHQAAEQWGMAAIADYEHAAALRAAPEQQQEHLLNQYFAQNTEHCFRYGKCKAYELCWQPGVAADPVGSGLFQTRVPHHNEDLDEA